MNIINNTVLHCCPCSGHRTWGGGVGREREPIPAVIEAAHGQLTVISLRHACLVAGLFDDLLPGTAINWQTLGDLIKKKWAGSVAAFLQDAAKVGASIQKADACVSGLRGAVIGWAGVKDEQFRPLIGPFGVSQDLNLTLAILSRCVSDIFIPARAPDYSWATLFDGCFVFDATLGTAPRLTEAPWSRFAWDDRKRDPTPVRKERLRSGRAGGWSHA